MVTFIPQFLYHSIQYKTVISTVTPTSRLMENNRHNNNDYDDVTYDVTAPIQG